MKNKITTRYYYISIGMVNILKITILIVMKREKNQITLTLLVEMRDGVF